MPATVAAIAPWAVALTKFRRFILVFTSCYRCYLRREDILPVLLKFAHSIDHLTEQLGRWLHWIVIFTVGIGFYNVTARYVGRVIGLKLSSNALIELQWYLFSLMFFLGFN